MQSHAIAASGMAALRERLRRIGWDRPVRPAHVPVPPVPGAAQIRLTRGVALFALFMLVLSLGPVTTLAHQLRASGFDPGPPIVGPWYTVFSLFDWITHGVTFNAPQRSAFIGAAMVKMLFESVFAGIGAVLVVMSGEDKIPKKYHGTKAATEWAALADYEQANLVGHGKPGVVIGAVRPPKILGIIPRKPEFLIYPGPRHVIVNAASRSGKDVGTNTCTQIVWPWSTITNDPKGENYLLASGIARDMYGKYVHRFNPGSPRIGETFVDRDKNETVENFGSSGWNLFDEIPWGTDYEFTFLLQAWTRLVCAKPSDLDGENGHWFRCARILGKGISYKVEYDPQETMRCVSRVAQLLGGDPDAATEEQHRLKASAPADGAEPETIHEMIEHYLGFSATGWGSKPKWLERSVEELRLRAEREIILKRREVGSKCSEADAAKFEIERRKRLTQDVNRLETAMHHPDMERDLRNIMRIKGDEASSVYSTINAIVTPWLDPSVIRNTRHSTFSIRSIVNADRPAGLWLVNPLERGDMFQPIFRVFMDIALRVLYPEMKVNLDTKEIRSPWRWPLLWMMNEIGTMGEQPMVPITLPVMASYQHLFVAMFQVSDQLQDIAGESGAKIITQNAGVQVFHTPQDDDIADKLAESLGERLYLKESESGDATKKSHNVEPDTVPLMSGQQVKEMPTEPKFIFNRDKTVRRVVRRAYQIVKAAGMRPGYSEKVQWFAVSHWARLIRKYRPALPDRLMIGKDDAVLFHAEMAAEKAVEAAPMRPETPTRAAARLATLVSLRALSPDEAAQVGNASESVAVEQSNADGGGAPAKRRRKLKAIALSEKVQVRESTPASAAAPSQVPESFRQFSR